jgi:SH3 domain-containing YSC84-like protein 1
MLGVDIYDCVVVINTKEALRAFTQTRMALGTDLAVSAGPWGAGGSIDVAAPPPTPPRPGQRPPAQGQPLQQPQQTYPNQPGPGHPGNMAPTAPNANYQPPQVSQQPPRDKSGRPQPVYSYVKSRGFYVGVAVDGTVVTERKDANAAFYGRQVSVSAILHGEVPPPPAARAMLDVVRGAEGWHGQGQGQAQGQWQNQQGPGQAPPPQGYYGASGYDSKTEYPQGPSGSGYSQQPSQQGAGYGTPASASAQAASNWKEAEMQEEARRNAAAAAASMQSPPPRYTDNTDAATTASTEIGEMPPAYSDDGRSRAGAGDNKSTGGHR